MRHHLAYPPPPHAAGDVKASCSRMSPADRLLAKLTRDWATRLDNGTETNQPKRAAALFHSHPEVW